MTDQPLERDVIPQATIHPGRRIPWVWLIPVVAAVFCASLIVKHVVKQGPIITVYLAHGHGIKPGDLLRCLGVVVGQVDRVELETDLEAVRLRVRLDRAATHVARAGSRFWVQRPRASLSGVGGLETIAGPRYLVVLPGHGPTQRQFVSLDEPPAVELIDPAGLELVLVAHRGRSLHAGAPVTYRQMSIGTVLSVGLASDATSVQVRVYIEPAYVRLVRDNSRFWVASGASTHWGLKGIRFQVESLQALLEGAVAMATPDPPGQRVQTGYRFVLDLEPEAAWLQWRPALPVGSALLPPGSSRPDMQRISSVRSGGNHLWSRTRSRQGWVLPVEGGVLGLADMLDPDADQVQCVIAGKVVEPFAVKRYGDLAWARITVPGAKLWPADQMGPMSEPEHCLVLTGPGDSPMPIDAANLQREDDRWLIDLALAFDASAHGAAVLSREDGRLVGFLVVQDGSGQIVELTPDE